MAKAFIPEIGSKLVLESDWTFDVHLEYRNSQLYEADGKSCKRWGQSGKSYKRTLPAGSVFMVDRIYVRNGADEYSSVTLLLLETTDPVLSQQGKKTQPFKSKGAKHFARFWVKLLHFNEAEFVVTHDAVRPSKTKKICGDPIELRRFKSRKYANWWVKFEHEDPQLCFDGEIQSRILDTCWAWEDGRPDLVSQGWTEVVKPGYGYKNKDAYVYTPPYYTDTLIPENWTKANSNVERFQVAVTYWGGRKDFIAKHPLEEKIHIPRFKKDRVSMGLKTDNDLIKEIQVAGGRLTICEVKEVEA